MYPQPPVQVILLVPEAAGTIFNTPDDGCCDTRNMYSSFAVNKYLHTVASVGFLFTLNYDARNHELKITTIYIHSDESDKGNALLFLPTCLLHLSGPNSLRTFMVEISCA